LYSSECWDLPIARPFFYLSPVQPGLLTLMPAGLGSKFALGVLHALPELLTKKLLTKSVVGAKEGACFLQWG
jgi:hypothetical protein